jgi:glyoxylase-like metal-dependent hydrolase (beta-lactamase superfamily II)
MPFMLYITAFTFNPFQENTYILYNDHKEAWIIDPGNQSPVEDQKLMNFIEDKNLKPSRIINTHAHLDHIFGNQALVEAYELPVFLHQGEYDTYRAAPQVAQMYGLPPFEIPPVTNFIDVEQPMYLGEESFQILFTPGHSPAEISLYHADSKSLIAGDVLFRDSIGRTDLPGGDHPTLLGSIREQFWPLPDKTTVYPGHGPQTTIGYEKSNNPFLN